MKTCPYCAEEIQDAAIACKHCGREIVPEAVVNVSRGLVGRTTEGTDVMPAYRTVTREPWPTRSANEPKPKRPIWKTSLSVGIGFGLLAVSGIISTPIEKYYFGLDGFLGALTIYPALACAVTAPITALVIAAWRWANAPVDALAQSQPSNIDHGLRIAEPVPGIAGPVRHPEYRASAVERPSEASRLFKYLFLLVLVVLLVSFLIALGTSGGDSAASNPQLASQATSQPTNGGSDVCSWFAATQTLRSRRISGLSELTTFMQIHDLNNMSETEIKQFVDILVRYQPYQREFIQAWEELGNHVDAYPYWEKEWESVQLRILAFGDIERGYQQNDAELFQVGLNKWAASQPVGLEGEAAMMDVRSNCLN